MNELKTKERAVLVEVKRFECKCILCNHAWTSSTEQLPKNCPGCASPRWNAARRLYPVRSDKGKKRPKVCALANSNNKDLR